jgi:hypothetical protein
VQGVDHGEQRAAPGGDADDGAGLDAGVEKEGGRGAEVADEVFFLLRLGLGRIDDDGRGEAEPGFERLFELRVDARGYGDADAYDVGLAGALEQARDGCSAVR